MNDEIQFTMAELFDQIAGAWAELQDLEIPLSITRSILVTSAKHWQNDRYSLITTAFY